MSKLDLRDNQDLYAILVVALVIRLWGFAFGLPDFHFFTDEGHVLGNVGALFGDVKRDFRYTSYAEFYGNVVEIVSGIVFLIAKVFGSPMSYQDFLAKYAFYIGRLLGVIYGTASVFYIYKIGELLWGKKEPALFSALVFSFGFLCVQNAHYAKQDNLMILCGLISFFYSIKVFITGGTFNYILSGLFAGLSFSAHRHGFPFLLVLIAAHFLKKEGSLWEKVRYRPFCIALLMAVMSFIIASPYNAYHFPKFLNNIWLLRFYSHPQAILQEVHGRYYSNFDEGFFSWYARYLWNSGFSWSFSILAILGVYVTLINKAKKRVPLISPEVLVYLAILLHGTVLLNLDHMQNRWLQFYIPFLSLLSGVGLFYIYETIRNNIVNKNPKLALITIAFIMSFYSPVKRCIAFDYYISSRDTRKTVSKWILKNMDKDSMIFFDMGSLHLVHYLQRNGFGNAVSLDTPERWSEMLKFHGDYVVFRPNYYVQAEKIEPTSEEVEIFKYISRHGKLVFESFVPIFESNYFGEYRIFTDTLHDYHNVRTQIYEIPKLEDIIGTDTEKNLRIALEGHKVKYEPTIDKTYLAKNLNNTSNFQLVSDPQALDNNALYAPLDKEGIISGPYEPFPRGRYIVKYNLKTDNNTLSDEIVFLAVTSAGGVTVYNKRSILAEEFKKQNEYQEFVLPFYFKKGSRLEFVLSTTKKSSIWIDSVKVVRLTDEEEFWKVAKEAGFKSNAQGQLILIRPLFSRLMRYTDGKLVEDKDSTDAVALLNGNLSGPYESFPEGDYTVTWRLKTDNNLLDDIVCSVDVAAGGGKALVQKALRGSEFKEADKYQEVSLPFCISADAQLEFRVHYTGKANLWLDKVEVTPK